MAEDQILRRVILDLIGCEFLVWLLWVPSELNPSDVGSRMVLEERMFERVYKGDMGKVFEEGNLFDRTQFHFRICDHRSQGEHVDAAVCSVPAQHGHQVMAEESDPQAGHP
jgi:hypothetical protein